MQCESNLGQINGKRPREGDGEIYESQKRRRISQREIPQQYVEEMEQLRVNIKGMRVEDLKECCSALMENILPFPSLLDDFFTLCENFSHQENFKFIYQILVNNEYFLNAIIENPPTLSRLLELMLIECEHLEIDRVYIKFEIPKEFWNLLRVVSQKIEYSKDFSEKAIATLVDISSYYNYFDIAENLILKFPCLDQNSHSYGETMLCHKLKDMPKRYLNLLVFLRYKIHDDFGDVLKAYDILEGMSLSSDYFSELGERVKFAKEIIFPIQQEISKVFNGIFFSLYSGPYALLPNEIKQVIYMGVIKDCKYLKDIPDRLLQNEIKRLSSLYNEVKSDQSLDMQAGRIAHVVRKEYESHSEVTITSNEVQLLKNFILFKLKQDKATNLLDQTEAYLKLIRF